MAEKQPKLTTKNKLKELTKLNIKSISDLDNKYINLLYEKINEDIISKKLPKQVIKKVIKKPIRIDKNSDKYKAVLNFVNKILKNLKKPEITDLLEFKNIDRLDIIKDINKQLLVDELETLIKPFDKKKANYYSAKEKNTYILSILRGTVKQITGLCFQANRKDVCVNRYRRTYMQYSIIYI